MLQSIIVPIFVCVVLPIAVVWITAQQKRNSDNIRAQILIKAIEANKDFDIDRLTEAMSDQKRTQRRSPAEIRNRRLLFGSMFSLIGLVFIVIGLIPWLEGLMFDNDSVACPMMIGGSSLAVGVSFLIVYFTTNPAKATEKKD